MSGFAAKILKETALVYDVRWRDESGTRFYAIFQADKAKCSAFLEEMKSDRTFNLEHYGTVLHLGFNEPPQHLRRELHEKYGMYREEFGA